MPSTYDNRGQRRRRPLGITLLCVLASLGVVVGFLGSLGLMAAGGPGPVLGLLVLGLTVARAVVIYGLWTLQYWGYKWSIIVYGFGAVLDLFRGQLLGVLISILIVVYLLTKAEYFE